MRTKSTVLGLAMLLAAALAPSVASAQMASGFLPQRAPLGEEMAAGEMPLQQVIAIAQRAGRGEYLNANRERDSVYRVKVIRPDGVVVHVYVDARNGNVLGVRDR